MSLTAKQKEFDRLQQSLVHSGLQTVRSNELICPLCWQSTPFDDLSLEHIVPSSVGGRQTTLTCRTCNNDHGRKLDSHLANFQQVHDAFRGHGHLRTKLNINGNEMVANLQWKEGQKSFHIVGKASNPIALTTSEADFHSGNVDEFTFTILYNYARNNFKTSLLRSAYLVLFKRFGYEYAKHSIANEIRKRVMDLSLEQPNIDSLIVEARGFRPPFDDQQYVIPGSINDAEFCLVILRIRRATTKYMGVYLPLPCDDCGKFFKLMNSFAKEQNGLKMSIPAEAILKSKQS